MSSDTARTAAVPGGGPEPALRGLLAEEASARLRRDGPNEIERSKGPSPLRLLLSQFASPLIALLAAACVVSAALGELLDAAVIAGIVVINGLVGFYQEYRAERALFALRSLTAPRARVLRDGTSALLPAREVVVGDLLLLEAGDVVAADARVLKAHDLATNEASLTGESMPAGKLATPAAPEAPLAERHDSVFAGTAVASGTGVAEVVCTGMRTELGKIATLLASAERSDTPLQQQLARVARVLIYACLGIVLLTALIGLARGRPGLELFMLAVSLAVAAVPEGLPTIVTIALSIGVQRMAARNVLVRKLPAVETLGSASVICTDKTGTLTTGVMAVRELWGPDDERMLDAAAACCDAELADGGIGGVGDPTELAILAAASEHGILRAAIERERPRVSERPFDAERKLMSVARADGTLYVKGAAEVVLARSDSPPRGALEQAVLLAGRGLRVLGVAVGRGESEQALEFVGLLAIADPPRPEAIAAVQQARAAGIKTVMITGDHPATAHAIARELGVLTGAEPHDETVHARATPEDKLNIVRKWKSRGAVVAMTGDGVNDAPALREAHIGVAMGKTGTEVTREASDMVLADDNYSSIIEAVREGRGIFDNIQKALVYLLAGNAGELVVMFFSALIGLPAPLLPLHLLWINLVTDGLPALALVTDRPDMDVLERPPRRLG
ncbi:MAG TPA: HAD-IC family P-type ATPase, partial [Polyangiaceae bacterium]|nr:HAD-IC family P-type ATPase [Polyangiaceae bacterium]